MLGVWWVEPFKGWFLGTERTDSNCNGDICPGNICPGDICPYKKYHKCYCLDFDQIKGKFLGQSLTDANHYGDICHYQEYLIC